MLRFFLSLILIALCTLFQGSVISMIPYINSTPNLLLIVTFSIGILRGRDEGLLYGLLCGIAMDLVSGGYLGFYALFYMYLGFGCGFLHQLFDVDVPLVAVILTILSEILYHLYVFLFRFVIRGRLSISSYISSIILPEMIFTIAFAILLYGIIVAMNIALEKYEQRSALKFV
ncbi:MAG: rod shape-determining protein MreD [Lachnospiraceae bacterium]|nr:rod shape-determining protein MreD [Lachnospiraceae bacterium]